MNPTVIGAFDQVTANEHPIFGAGPTVFYGPDAPDGDASPWKDAAPGSQYIRTVITGTSTRHGQTWTKTKDDGADDDWSGVGIISDTVTVAQFTDGGSTAGTFDLPTTIPAGAWVHRCFLQNVTGFAGNTSAVITVGDGTDVDRYNTGTPSVFTTAVAIDLGAASGTAIHVTAATVRLTVTTATDFTAAVTNGSGKLTVKLVYYI